MRCASRCRRHALPDTWTHAIGCRVQWPPGPRWEAANRGRSHPERAGCGGRCDQGASGTEARGRRGTRPFRPPFRFSFPLTFLFLKLVFSFPPAVPFLKLNRDGHLLSSKLLEFCIPTAIHYRVAFRDPLCREPFVASPRHKHDQWAQKPPLSGLGLTRPAAPAWVCLTPGCDFQWRLEVFQKTGL